MCDIVGVSRSSDIIRCVVDLICANGVVRVSIGAVVSCSIPKTTSSEMTDHREG